MKWELAQTAEGTLKQRHVLSCGRLTINLKVADSILNPLIEH